MPRFDPDILPEPTAPTARRLRLYSRLLLFGTLALAVALAGWVTLHRWRSGFAEPIDEVHALLEGGFIREPEAETLQRAAIEGMLAALDDPYTSYIPPVEADDFALAIEGRYAGIGAEVEQRDGWPVIVTPLDGSPALRAGLRPGDLVTAIDGEPTRDVPLDRVIDRIKGEPGSVVRLGISRGGESLAVDIVRDQIRTEPVQGVRRDGERWRFLLAADPPIAYVRIGQFLNGTAAAVRADLALAAREAGVTPADLAGLIIDLRWNPGGTLAEAIATADLFLDDGVIVSTADRDGRGVVTRATPGDIAPGVPIVVLINEGSASASEILAGALAEQPARDGSPARAIALGTRTLGKGSVQRVVDLLSKPRARLKFTAEAYMLPSGRSLQRHPGADRWGVDPSPGFHRALTRDEAEALFAARRELRVIRTDGPAPAEPPERWDDLAWTLERLADPQLAAAATALIERRRSGDWLPPFADTRTDDERARDAERDLLEREATLLEAQLESVRRRLREIGAGERPDGG